MADGGSGGGDWGGGGFDGPVRLYILGPDRRPYNVPQGLEASWAEWMRLNREACTVGYTRVGMFFVNTTFNGFDLRSGEGPLFGRIPAAAGPVVFGTTLLRIRLSKAPLHLTFECEWAAAAATWAEAEKQHVHAVTLAQLHEGSP